ncbi:hypothetical protein N9N67_01300 [Bacteriovoracaceae bacterium]|nr:hypothetical protein [Bacteriovoracaceae bacterium]
MKFWQESLWNPHEEIDDKKIKISSFQMNEKKPFFELTISLETLGRSQPGSSSSQVFFNDLLYAVKKLDQSKFGAGEIVNRFNFHLKYGFGSSSTSIKNISSLFNIDPWKLYFSAVNGSGADLAATFFSPGNIVLYTKDPLTMKQVTPQWDDIFEKSLFIYLGSKVSSKKEIDHLNFNSENKLISQIDNIIHQLFSVNSIDKFIPLLKKHEQLISLINGQEVIQEKLFSDFPGGIKSLGAWGGDYIWAISEKDLEDIKTYFKNKNYNQFYSYQELVN